jgi:hypothetical protein
MPAIEVWIHILAANWEIFYEGLIWQSDLTFFGVVLIALVL